MIAFSSQILISGKLNQYQLCQRPKCHAFSSSQLLSQDDAALSLWLCSLHAGEFLKQQERSVHGRVNWADGEPVQLRANGRLDVATLPWPAYVRALFRRGV